MMASWSAKFKKIKGEKRIAVFSKQGGTCYPDEEIARSNQNNIVKGAWQVL